MASIEHEAVVELLRNRPELALELLAVLRPEFVDVARLAGGEACIESVDFGDAKPLERSADFVASFGTEPDGVRVTIRSSPSSRLEHTEIIPMY